MYMETIRGRYRLYARSPRQPKATVRDWGDSKDRLIGEGARLARLSIDEGGVMAAWIVDTRHSETVWSAGDAPQPADHQEGEHRG